MDKNTLSNYGWVVCVILILAIMISLATPFGSVIKNGVAKTVTNFKNDAEGVLDNMGGATSFDDLGGGSSGGAGGGESQPPSVEDLQEKHAFEYYSTLSAAVNAVNDGTIGTSADADKENAVAGIYVENNNAHVVLLKSTTEPTRIEPNADMTINLGGYTFSTSDAVCIDSYSGNVVVDGRLAGSSILHDVSTGKMVQVRGGSFTINGGNYISTVQTGTNNVSILSMGNLAINDATITATSTGEGVDVRGVNNKGGTFSASNSNIQITSPNGIAVGLYNSGTATLSDCDVEAYSSYSLGVYNTNTLTLNDCDIEAYSNYTADGSQISKGVEAATNAVVTTFNNCNITSVHSAVTIAGGALYVNGGTYEGYGHGGFYFANTNGTSYVRNATIRQCAMPEGFSDLGGGCNNTGFYIGGTSGHDINVYMDSCNIYGTTNAIALRGTAGEENNALYISNSNIDVKSIRIDNDTHRLYIGTGCNFTASNTNRADVVTQTDLVYVQE